MSLRSEFIAWYFNEFKFDPLYIIMDGMAEDSPWHREDSIGIHTNMVVTEYLSRIVPFEDFNTHLRGLFAAAFHDVGKPGACEFKWKDERGDYKSFNGHELLSARLWEDWAVRNWGMLVDRFDFQVEDIYRVAWLIEYHKPWDIKNPDKLNKMALTALTAVNRSVFTRLIESDTWGRLSDDQTEKRAKVGAWIAAFHDRCEEILRTTDFNPDGLVLKEWDKQSPRLIIPIGASGSGKSTMSKGLFTAAEPYSWDALRLEWYSSDYDEAFRLSCEDKQFMSKVNGEFSRRVKTGQSIFVDNTNLSAKRRRFFVDQARRGGYHTTAVLMPVALQTVQDRQSTRTDKVVPANVVEQQYLHLQVPQFDEFDEIIVYTGNLE